MPVSKKRKKKKRRTHIFTRTEPLGKAIVSYLLPGEFQYRTGVVVRYGSKTIDVIENNRAIRTVTTLDVKGNLVRFLLGAENPYGSKKQKRMENNAR